MTGPGEVLALLRSFEVEDLSVGGGQWVPWGRIARDWQVADVEALLDLTPRWHLWLRPRSASKSQDAGLFALACLLTIQPPFTTTHIFARDAEQATIIFDKIAHLRGRHDNLTVTGRQITNTDTGASISVEASDAASALGATPWGVIADELMGWPDTRGHRRLWANVLSGLGKRPDSWLLVITSAGDPASPFYEVVTTAEATPEDWRFSRLPGPPPFMSGATVARARRNLPESVFEWHYMNRFAAPDNALATKEELDAAFADAPPSRRYDPAQQYLVTADLSETHDATVLLVTHMEAGDVLVVDLMERYKPTRLRPIRFPTIKRRIMALSDEYGGARVRMDKSRGEQMLQEMSEDGYLIEAYPFTVESHNQLALSMQRLTRERGLRLIDNADMRDELASVFVQASGEGKIKIEHHSGRHNDIAICLAMGAHYWLAQPFRGGRTMTANTAFFNAPPPLHRDRRANLPLGSRRVLLTPEQHARRTMQRVIRRR